MKLVTIRNAKAHLNQLVALAEKGEEVILMRGSKPVISFRPISEDDVELAPTLTDVQAARFWKQVEEERKSGKPLEFPSAEEAVRYLREKFGPSE